MSDLRARCPSFERNGAAQAYPKLRNHVPRPGTRQAGFNDLDARLWGRVKRRPLDGRSPLWKSFVRVDEEGTEAAAATSVAVIPSLPPTFAADRAGGEERR